MDSGEINNLSSFKTLKVNPCYLLHLINRYVQVQLLKNTIISGFIHSIDPIDHSLIILVPQEDKFHTTLIPGHAILDLCEKEPDANIIIPIKQTSKLSTEYVAKRKFKVMMWLKENLLPVSEVNDNIVIGNVRILPPYELTDVCTDNPIVAMQILNIMDKMPYNYCNKINSSMCDLHIIKQFG